MTAKLGSAATAKTLQRLIAPSGINAALAALTVPGGEPVRGIELGQIRAQNVSIELSERTGTVQYPAVNVYCQKISNDLKEKFRVFSGKAVIAIEVRHSQDRLEGLETNLQLYADSISQTLNGERGNWGDGMFYSGGYDVAFGPVKHGGKNFLQAATITFEVSVSR